MNDIVKYHVYHDFGTLDKAQQAKKVADLLRQLKEAGVTITTIEKEGGPKSLAQLRNGSLLSQETIDSIARMDANDFGAWVAWTLRF